MHSFRFAAFLMGPLAAVSISTAQTEASWLIGVSGSTEIPSGAVWAGSEAGAANYVCRAPYMGGIHPGKLLAGHCNIEFAGQELVRDDFEVLTAEESQIKWVPDSVGFVPPWSFSAGEENGMSLYACRAQVKLDETDRGEHAGKLVGENCNIPYGGGAYLSRDYAVLVIGEPPVSARKPMWKPARAPFRGAAKGYSADGRDASLRSGAVLR